MPRSPDLDTEWIKRKLAKIALEVEKGEIEPKRANCMAGIWGKCLYAIQIQNREEDTGIARQLLEQQEKLLCEVRGGSKPRIIDLKEGVD